MKRIYWNAFEMNCVGHINHGLWKIPGNKRAHYKNLEYWTDLAKTLEKGRFDALFLADVVGLYDVYKGGLDTSIKEAVQIPANDPFIPISAMAHVTSNLSFAVTFSTSYEHPYGETLLEIYNLFVRKLKHLFLKYSSCKMCTYFSLHKNFCIGARL